MAKKKKIKDKQRAKLKEKKARVLVAELFEELKADTIMYKCLECGNQTAVPRILIETNITIDEYGDIDIPGYACEACDATMVPSNPDELYYKI